MTKSSFGEQFTSIILKKDTSKTPRALTIAGSDSGGGAGIQVDLMTFATFGVYGTSVVTVVTAQNTQRILQVQAISPSLIRSQLEAVMEDIGVDAVKIGMLANANVVNEVAKFIRRNNLTNVVVDPVMFAKSGVALLNEEGVEVLKKELIPIVTLVTPNLPEAEVLWEKKISSSEDIRQCAEEIFQKYKVAVVIKGGHWKGPRVIDTFHDGQKIREFQRPRVAKEFVHGTGCAFSSTITALLARGYPLSSAVELAGDYTTLLIRYCCEIGKGVNSLYPLTPLYREIEKITVISQLKDAVEILRGENIAPLIPEVGSNLVMALEKAESGEEVAGISGRIVKLGDSISVVGEPAFGASSHMARVLLTMMQYFPRVRSAINICYREDILTFASELGFSFKEFQRIQEPEEIKKEEGKTLIWGMDSVLRGEKSPPDIIFDRGDWGKEPMIRLFGMDALEVTNKVRAILRRLPGIKK